VPWWRKLLALLGLSNDARVRVRAPGIEVILTGEPELVRAVLHVVKAEIERVHRIRRMGGARPGAPIPPAPPGAVQPAPLPPGASGSRRRTGSNSDSQQIVLPSELDDMDSPYAIPEHRPARPEDESTPIENEAVPISGSEGEDTAPGQDALKAAEITSGPSVATVEAPPGSSNPAGGRARTDDLGATDPELRASPKGKKNEPSAPRPPQPRDVSGTWQNLGSPMIGQRQDRAGGPPTDRGSRPGSDDGASGSQGST
jgi:hypothetical protein